VELEGVGAVAVGGVLGHVLREVDDHDRVERALLHADATPENRVRFVFMAAVLC